MDESLKSLARLVKQERLKRGIEQRRLGRILHINYTSISRFESFQRVPRPETLEQLMNYFGIERRDAYFKFKDDYELRTVTCKRCLNRIQFKV